MKYLGYIVILFLLSYCTPNKSAEQKFYIAKDKEKMALLSLTIDNNEFYGQYKLLYSTDIIDQGEVRGALIGDTLRGRFKYISYGGSEKIKPFMLLKKGEVLKLGNGIEYTYMNIPYYSTESIEFKDSSFHFHPINKAAFEKLDLKFKGDF